MISEKFFIVGAKCGHVGRAKYYLADFYVRALSKADASRKVRWMPRVKHHQRDAIISVEEISYHEFRKGNPCKSDAYYFVCKNIQEQQRNIEFIQDKIFADDNSNITELDESEDNQLVFCYKNQKIKNPKKYFNRYFDYNEIEVELYA